MRSGAFRNHLVEKVVTKLRQAEVLVGQGMRRIDAIREIEIVEQAFLPLAQAGWRNGRGPGEGTQTAKKGE